MSVAVAPRPRPGDFPALPAAAAPPGSRRLRWTWRRPRRCRSRCRPCGTPVPPRGRSRRHGLPGHGLNAKTTACFRPLVGVIAALKPLRVQPPRQVRAKARQPTQQIMHMCRMNMGAPLSLSVLIPSMLAALCKSLQIARQGSYTQLRAKPASPRGWRLRGHQAQTKSETQQSFSDKQKYPWMPCAPGVVPRCSCQSPREWWRMLLDCKNRAPT